MLITKSPTLGTTSANHTARAMMSQEPVKRVVAVLETSAPLALFPSVSDRFMHLSLLQERRKTQRLRDRFLSSSAISYHTSVPKWRRWLVAYLALTVFLLETVRTGGPRHIAAQQADPLRRSAMSRGTYTFTSFALCSHNC